jgi:4-diphosphocytidyl-2-C-methyl-D-erythritol kinase
MLRFPNAKINLGLFITHRRTDGFHELETIFLPVPQLRDALEMVPAAGGRTKLHLSGLEVGGDPEANLTWKAYDIIERAFPGKLPPLDIYLHKVIPMGAGLGGGSADAAVALQMLNELGALGISDPELEEYALELGSDCPFFVRNTPQFATGRGEKMTPVELDLSGYRIEIVTPEIHVSTRAAFSRVSAKPAPIDLRTLGQIPVREWQGVVRNDFEDSVFVQFPEIAAIKQRLYDQGAVYASMSGSGSSVYGVFGI